MEVDVRKIEGPWDLGYSLDKHNINSIYIGGNEFGNPRFDTTRTEVGEALYQLKYKYDQSQVTALATQLVISLGSFFRSASFVVPMPSSKQRDFQPVTEIAGQVADMMNIPCREDVLVKTAETPQMKDITSKKGRVKALCSAFEVKETRSEENCDVLIIDDLYDTGATLKSATIMLQECVKIRKIYVAALTRTK